MRQQFSLEKHSGHIPEEYQSSGHYQEIDRLQNRYRLSCPLRGKDRHVASNSAKLSYDIPARSFSCSHLMQS